MKDHLATYLHMVVAVSLLMISLIVGHFISCIYSVAGEAKLLLWMKASTTVQPTDDRKLPL